MQRQYKLLAIFLLVTATAFGKDKPEPTYQDATLKSYRIVQSGTRCHSYGNTDGTVRANTDPQGNTNGNLNSTTITSTNCSPNTQYEYTVTMGEQIIVLAPKVNFIAERTAGGLLGLAHKQSVLSSALPGTPILIRSEGSTIYVKVGKKESGYTVVGAQ